MQLTDKVTLATAGTLAQLRTFSLIALTGALTKEVATIEPKAKKFAKILAIIDEKREVTKKSISAYARETAGYKDTNAIAVHSVIAALFSDAWTPDSDIGPDDKIGEHHFDKASVLALKAASQVLTHLDRKFKDKPADAAPLRAELAKALRTGGDGCTKAIETIKAGVAPEKPAKTEPGTGEESDDMKSLRAENEQLKASLLPLTPDRILGLLTRDTFFAPMAEIIVAGGEVHLSAMENARTGFDALCQLAVQRMATANTPATPEAPALQSASA